jgi:hypothetical protein
MELKRILKQVSSDVCEREYDQCERASDFSSILLYNDLSLKKTYHHSSSHLYVLVFSISVSSVNKRNN